jgi:hypothetical protein
MEKQRLNQFIDKYHLGGLVETVMWNIEGNSLSTSFISGDKSVLGKISLDSFTSPDSEFGVYDTKQLRGMLGVLENDVEFKTLNVGDKITSLDFSDKATSVNYMVADKSVVPTPPALKGLPDFDIEITLNDTFISKFIRAKGALADQKTFTFISKGGKNQIVIGYSKKTNTNRIFVDVDATSNGDAEISFSADYFKEILVANKGASEATMKISTQGLSHLKFEEGDFVSEYFLVEVNKDQ